MIEHTVTVAQHAYFMHTFLSIMLFFVRTMDDVDLFTGGISERPLAGSMVGPTFACILSRQFKNLKFGDRFWYESPDRTVGFTDSKTLFVLYVSENDF